MGSRETTPLLLLLALTFGCGAAVPRPPIQAPAPAAGALAEPAPRTSEAKVSIVLRQDALRETLDRELPNPIHREERPRLEAEAHRGDLRLEPGQGALRWTLPVELWAKARLGPLRFSCGVGEPRPHVDVTLRTEMVIGDDWSLTTETTPGPRQWSRRCRVSFLNIDVTSILDPHIERAQRQAATRIDRETARFDLPSVVEQIWPLLAFPAELESEGEADERLRLLLRPEGLRVSELTGDSDALELKVRVLGRFLITPRFVSSPPPPVPPPSDNRGGPFLVALELTRPLSALEASLRAGLEGTEVRVDDRPARVAGVQARFTEQGLAIGLALEGSLVGTVWALGSPVYREGAIQVVAPHWTAATRRAIGDADLAEGLEAVLLGRLSDWRWPMGDALGEIRERAVRGMTGFALPEGVTIEAELTPTEGDGAVFGEGDTLVLQVPTPGSLEVTIDAVTVAGSL
jgi:hypothetical protein